MIDVIIVNWNSGEQLRECVDSLLRHPGRYLAQVIVVDNASSDASLEKLEADERISLIRVGENLGFARACNLGVNRATSKYILLLNPDTRVFDSSLDAAVDFMEQPHSSRVGIVGVQTVADNGQLHRSCARFPTPRSFLVHSFGLNALSSRLFSDHFMREWAHDADREVDHVIGAYFLVRRSLWMELGGMDERFFVYLEDLDFSLRAHARGWKTWFLARAQIYHRGGGTSDQVRAKRLFYSLRSRLLYAAKHFSCLGFWSVAIAALLVEPVMRAAQCVLKLDWSGLSEVKEGYVLLYRDLPNILRRTRSRT